MGGGKRGRGERKDADILAENPLTSPPSQCFSGFVFDTQAPHPTSRPVLKGGGKINKRGSAYKASGEVGERVIGGARN